MATHRTKRAVRRAAPARDAHGRFISKAAAARKAGAKKVVRKAARKAAW